MQLIEIVWWQCYSILGTLLLQHHSHCELLMMSLSSTLYCWQLQAYFSVPDQLVSTQSYLLNARVGHHDHSFGHCLD